MSEEDGASMEQLVEDYASELSSDDALIVLTATKRLDQRLVLLTTDYSPPARIEHSRLLQELLAYKRGSMVARVLERVLDMSVHRDCSATELWLDLFSCLSLVALTENQLTARFCLQQEASALKTARSLMNAYKTLVKVEETNESGPLLSSALIRGFLNLSRASKAFRTGLKELQDLFPAMEHLLSQSIGGYCPAKIISNVLPDIIQLMNVLILSEETREWALHQGIMRVHASINRLLMRDVSLNQGRLQESKSFDPKLSESARSRKILAAHAEQLLEADRQMRRPETDKDTAKDLRDKYLKLMKKAIFSVRRELTKVVSQNCIGMGNWAY